MAITERTRLEPNNEREIRFDRDTKTLLYIDRRSDSYSAYWSTPIDIDRFVSLIRLDPNISETSQVEAVFEPSREDGGRIQTHIDQVRNHPSFPEQCSFFAALTDSYEITWEKEEFTDGNEVTLLSRNFDGLPLIVYYWVTLGNLLPDEELEEILPRIVDFVGEQQTGLKDGLSRDVIEVETIATSFFGASVNELIENID